MAAFLVRRIALAFVTLFTVLTLVFVIVRILPGDPAQLILGDQASREAIEALHVRLGLDQPILLQYASFLGNALSGDWGVSMVTGQPVSKAYLKAFCVRVSWAGSLGRVGLPERVSIGAAPRSTSPSAQMCPPCLRTTR